jgi:hypothetical protein
VPAALLESQIAASSLRRRSLIMVKKVGQRRFLLKCGYTNEQLDHMTPHEAHTIISETEKANRELRKAQAKKEKAAREKLERENHIREMASDMDYGCTKHDLWPDDAKEIAKALTILGYQKVKENEVVIPKTEYERLMSINPPVIPVLTQDHLNYITLLENREKALEKCLKAANTELDQRMHWWESCKKETTYGLLKRLYDKFVKYACVGDYYTESDIEKELQEIAKETGVKLPWKIN